jgi:hypothetical protein
MKYSITHGQLRMLSEFFSNLSVAWFAATFISYTISFTEEITIGFLLGIICGIMSLIYSFNLARKL